MDLFQQSSRLRGVSAVGILPQVLIQGDGRTGLAGGIPFQMVDALQRVLPQGAIGILLQKLLKHSQVGALPDAGPVSQLGDPAVRRRGLPRGNEGAGLEL